MAELKRIGEKEKKNKKKGGKKQPINKQKTTIQELPPEVGKKVPLSTSVR